MNSQTFHSPSRRRLNSSMLAGASLAILGFALAAGVGGVALAQDQAASGTTNEVVVTGSRIVKRDYTSNSPIVTVNSQTLENSANVALEATLNKLPQFVPDQNLTGVQSQDVQPTATHTIGISTASLRGLGPNRNLVLVDGKRPMPQNGELVVDLNSIPSAAIDRVEVITGGASAVYGADAVGGVVNFILKKNFTGLTVDGQYAVNGAGDGREFKISALFGANFADDRGNVMFGLEHFTRAPSYQKNRDFYTKGWADPTVGNNEFFFTGAAFSPTFGAPSQAAVDSIFSDLPPGSVPANAGLGEYYFNTDGTIFTGAAGLFGAPGPLGSSHFKGAVDGKNYAYYNVLDPYQGNAVEQAIKTNQTNYYVLSPLNRWSTFGQAHYDINENLTVYGQGNFAESKTHTILFPTPFITGWGVNVPRDAAHPVPTELATLLDSRSAFPGAAAGTGAGNPWELFLIPDPSGWMPPRSDDVDNTVWQVQLGLKGNVPHTPWTFDLYGTHGQASSYDLGLGYASLVRYEALIQAPNYGAGATLTGNQVAPNYGFGAASVHCTSGFYDTIFLGGTPSQDCIDAVTAKLQSQTYVQQDVVEFDTQGDLFTLPAGMVKGSLGASFREDTVQYNPDILQSTSSFTDQVAGVYPTAYMDAGTSAREGYGELLVPLLADAPAVKSLSLELGARYSTYTAFDRLNHLNISPDGGWTYKILGDWAVNDWVRLRGGYNLAVRAPNVGELFLGKQEVYAAGAATNYGDPCSLAATAPFGAGGAGPDPVKGTTAPVVNSGGLAGAESALRICKALMGGPTSPGATTYYGQTQAAGAASPFGFVYQEGNPNLSSEKAKTWTAGIVLRSPSQSPLLSRASLSIDWYRIAIYGAIEFQSVDNIKEACLSQSAPDDATAATIAASPACQLLSRNAGSGAEAPTTIQYDNLSTLWTSGVDFNLNWTFDLADVGLNSVPGSLNVNLIANYLDYYDTQSAPGQPIVHWAGTLGPNLNGTNAGAFRYRTNLSVTYMNGPGSIGVTWRHLPGVHSQTYAITGGGGTAAGDFTVDTPSHDEVDLFGSYTFMKNYILRAGINNLFDAAPEITGQTVANPGFTLPSSGQGTTMEGLYDALGRRFFVGLTAKF